MSQKSAVGFVVASAPLCQFETGPSVRVGICISIGIDMREEGQPLFLVGKKVVVSIKYGAQICKSE